MVVSPGSNVIPEAYPAKDASEVSTPTASPPHHQRFLLHWSWHVHALWVQACLRHQLPSVQLLSRQELAGPGWPGHSEQQAAGASPPGPCSSGAGPLHSVGPGAAVGGAWSGWLWSGCQLLSAACPAPMAQSLGGQQQGGGGAGPSSTRTRSCAQPVVRQHQMCWWVLSTHAEWATSADTRNRSCKLVAHLHHHLQRPLIHRVLHLHNLLGTSASHTSCSCREHSNGSQGCWGGLKLVTFCQVEHNQQGALDLL
jgi:hypothetical protein